MKINLFFQARVFFYGKYKKNNDDQSDRQSNSSPLAHKGVQLSHLESQQIEILSHKLSCAHCKLLSGFGLVKR